MDGQGSGAGKLGAGQTMKLSVLGRGGVPATGVGAVALNVTVTNGTTGSFLTVFPTGSAKPTASNVNFGPNQTIPNMVLAKLGTDNTISIYNALGATDVIADVAGWYPAPTQLSVTTTTLATATAGLRYQQPVDASGGIEPYTWTATGLPAGLIMSLDGAITGSPTSIGNASVQVHVTDALGTTASKTLNLATPTSVPAGCVGQSCQQLTPNGQTITIPAANTVSVTRDPTTQTVTTVTVTGAAPAVDQIVVFAASTPLPSGLIALVTAITPNGSGTTTLAVTPGSFGDAYADGTIQALGPPMNAQTNGADLNWTDAAPTEANTNSAVGCEGNVAFNTNGTGLTTSLTPSLAAVWNHPLFGGGGFYPGVGGLKVFQADIEGTITVALQVNVSAAAHCTASVPALHYQIPAGDLGAVIIDLQPTLDLNVSGNASIRTSVTLTCGTQYRWSQGQESKVSYCGAHYEPLRVLADAGVDATLSAGIDAMVTLDEIAGITGHIGADLHAGYHPLQQPIAQIDVSVPWNLGACLLCFWKDSPAHVTFANGIIYQRTLWQSHTPPDTPPPQPRVLNDVDQVSVGGWHTCALASGGFVRCWGRGAEGQLGNGTLGDANGVALSPIRVVGLSGVEQLESGGSFTCALLGEGTVRCWGDGRAGQLGDGTFSIRSIPVAVGGLTNTLQLAAGWAHVCSLAFDGTVKCWGADGSGELGDGTTGDPNNVRLSPVAVQSITGATQVTAGGEHTCALIVDGTVKCWGADESGQLGDGSTGDADNRRLTAVAVSSVTNATQIAAGQRHTCALIADGTVKCWGNNTSGQIGDGTIGDASNHRLTPVTVVGITNAVQITAGVSNTCAQLLDGSIQCWGDNEYGQVGDGSIFQPRLAPVNVVGVTDGLNTETGYRHTCSLLKDHSLTCWGWDYFGQLGDGTNGDAYSTRPTPVSVMIN